MSLLGTKKEEQQTLQYHRACLRYRSWGVWAAATVYTKLRLYCCSTYVVESPPAQHWHECTLLHIYVKYVQYVLFCGKIFSWSINTYYGKPYSTFYLVQYDVYSTFSKYYEYTVYSTGCTYLKSETPTSNLWNTYCRSKIQIVGAEARERNSQNLARPSTSDWSFIKVRWYTNGTQLIGIAKIQYNGWSGEMKW